jgi:pimeloyl-ACP methyl ester carboxylesterase
MLVAGCLPSLPDNTTAEPLARTFYANVSGAVLQTEEGLDDAVWIEIPSTSGGGTAAGYLSLADAANGALLILVRGASSYQPGGGVGATRHFHEVRGQPYRDAGYRTLSLDLPECGTAYGQEDVACLVQLIDWLDAGGRQALGVDRVYVLGYSVGATCTLLANRQRTVTAVTVLSPVTEPEQFEVPWLLYYLASELYPNNEGLCQLGSTLAFYGLPGSAGWQIFDTVGHVAELQSPMLVIQGTEDQIYSIENAQHLDTAYHQAVAAGLSLPEIDFLFVQGADHFAPMDDPVVTQVVLTFFDHFAQ